MRIVHLPSCIAVLIIALSVRAQPGPIIPGQGPFIVPIGYATPISISFENYGRSPINGSLKVLPAREFSLTSTSLTVPGMDSTYWRPGEAQVTILVRPLHDTCIATLYFSYGAHVDSLLLIAYRSHPFPNVDCFPFYPSYSYPTTPIDSLHEPLKITNLTRDTALVSISFNRHDSIFVVKPVSPYISMAPEQAIDLQLCFYPKVPGWSSDTMHVVVRNSSGDTDIVMPLHAGYGHWYGVYQQDVRDSAGLLFSDPYMRDLFPIKDTGYYFVDIGCDLILPSDPVYTASITSAIVSEGADFVSIPPFNPFKVAGPDVYQGGTIPIILHPNLEAIVDGHDSTPYFTIKCDYSTSDGLPFLNGDTAAISGVFKFINPLRDTFDLENPSYLRATGVNLHAIGYRVARGDPPIYLILRAFKSFKSRILNLRLLDTSDFTILGGFPYGDTLDGCYSVALQFKGMDTGLYRNSLILHLQSAYDGIDTVFTIPMYIHVTDGLAAVAADRKIPNVQVFPNPTFEEYSVNLQNVPSGSVEALDETGRRVSLTSIRAGCNKIKLPLGVHGILLLRFVLNPSNGQPFVEFRKLLVQ